MLSLLACRPETPPEPDAAADLLASLEGHWELTWTRPEPWRPLALSGPLVVRQTDGEWIVSLAFDAPRTAFVLSSVGEADGRSALTFASGQATFELRLARTGPDLVGEARSPGALDWSPVLARPTTPTPAAIPGPALRPIRFDGPEPVARLSPIGAFEATWRPPPVLSGDGSRVWLWEHGGKLWTGPADGSEALVAISDAAVPPPGSGWVGATPSGDVLYAQRWGGIVAITRDGARSELVGDLGEIRWVEPRWSQEVLVVASAASEGVRVVEVSLTDGRVVERFAHATADDLVLDASGSVRLLVERERVRSGNGVFADVVTLRSPTGERLGSVRQPAWVRATSLAPRIGSSPVHLLGGGDLATLGRLGPHGIASDPSPGQWGDAVSWLVDPDTAAVDAVGWRAERLHWDVRTPNGEEMVHLQAELDADVEVLQRVADDRRWLVAASSGSRPLEFLLFDRDARTLRALRAPGAAPERSWRPVDALALETRDGGRVAAYITRPEGSGPWPLVVEVHGGPWAGRHGWDVDPQAQRWAERGYATLAVDFRGTHGFGWSRMEATEFGDDPMIHDVEDGIRWAIAQGVADPDRIAMVGSSYGGYAALRFATAEVPMLRCAVGGLVRGNLTVPGGGLNISAVKDPAWREAHSPDRFTERLTAPVLVWNGGRDGDNADAIRDFVARADALGKAVAWVRFPWEAHGLRDPVNQAALDVIVDRFLGACLGGPAWDFPRDFERAELEVRAGVALVPGLAERVR